MGPDYYPDSRLKSPKGIVRGPLVDGTMINWVPIFCAHCGKPGGYVPEENMSFAFYLCDHPCSDQMGHLDGILKVPDEVFWAEVKAFQIEKYGRELSAYEMSEVLKDDRHPLTRLCKDRKWRGA